nr:unnamed protein product [Digitaria exilis]
MANLVGSMEKIASNALAIKEAVETVCVNKNECVDIGRRVMRIRALLTHLQGMEMMTIKEPAMVAYMLGALQVILSRTRKLVMECQQRSVVRSFVGARDLCKQLRDVKQEMSDHIMDGVDLSFHGLP